LLKLNEVSRAEADEIAAKRQEALEQELSNSRNDDVASTDDRPGGFWTDYQGGPEPQENIVTGVDKSELSSLLIAQTQLPPDFQPHPKIKKLLDGRRAMAEGREPLDWSAAESLALATLAIEGHRIRLSGQDTARGTFSQRHAVLHDQNREKWDVGTYVPLQNVSDKQAPFTVIDSVLSEEAVLGFEYGFSSAEPNALVIWEAQFGDFVNGAQSIIDQFIAAGEAKWGLLSGVVLLLPHGYEGQGPEHSSARMERFLQLAANDNMIIAQPSNAAQYYHLLRRQAISPYRKPLILFTPKSMLRHPDAVSPIADFAAPRFCNVLADNEAKDPHRILVCSGKIGHNLRVERAKRGDYGTAIVFVEQLYPWPEAALIEALEQYPHAEEIIWVQEEPANMGALTYAMPLLRQAAGNRRVLSIKRSAAASPATGSAKAHELEEKALIELALGPAQK